MGNRSCQINFFSFEGLKCLAQRLTENNGSPHGFAPTKVPSQPPAASTTLETFYETAPAPTATDYERTLRADPNFMGEMLIRHPERELSAKDTHRLARALAGVAIMSLINGAMNCVFNNNKVECFSEGALRTWEGQKD